MKNKILLFILGLTLTVSCNNETDLYPLSEGSADKWYSSETEIKMALNDMYRIVFWYTGNSQLSNDEDSDDLTIRNSLTPVTDGSQGGQWGKSTTLWTNSYKAIGRANTILTALNRADVKANISSKALETYIAEALFIRAAQYGNLVNHFGDIVYIEQQVSIEEAFEMSRMPKEEVMVNVYRDLDIAAEKLPTSYANQTKRATSGMAYAFKARIAIRNNDFKTAAEAAKACMDLGEYKLHDNYANLFLSSTKNSEEGVFILPRSLIYDVAWGTTYYLPRNISGYAMYSPSWDIAAAYLCTDGLPIDESSKYDPSNPFENRDPRMAASIIEVGKDKVVPFLGVDYDPNPYAVEVMNHNIGKMIKNNDNRVNAQYAAFNGLLLRKGSDDDWLRNGQKVEPDLLIIRYADVLLMYAEAKIELNDIDQSVLDAINLVRARAYGVPMESVSEYPAVTSMSQSELRKTIRFERRMEFAFEGLRYNDLIRWRIAEKALNLPNYGMLEPEDLKSKVVDAGLWFFPGTPEIDENGIADYSAFENAGLARVLSERKFMTRQYLWAIPSKEILINGNLTQNEGY